MRIAVFAIAASVLPAALPAQPMVSAQADLRHYAVTIVRFDPALGPQRGQQFVLPVDSPDEEHAIASTLANAAAFSHKADGDRAFPVAFMARRVTAR